MKKVLDIVKPGVLVGKDVLKLFDYAKNNEFAIPAANVTSTSTVNAALEAAREVNSPIILEVSNGGASFFSGKELSNENQKASILGAVSLAKYVHNVAKDYGIPVILHTDHCQFIWLKWLDGLVKENQKFFRINKKPLFSSHMIDLSKENLKTNIRISKSYLKKLSKMGITLEVEIGVTGGEEDGLDNTNIDNSRLYTQVEDIEYAYREFSKISDKFTIAATFGNVHGVYKPGNVKLRPEILDNIQKHIKNTFKTKLDKPLNLVFHGSSGSRNDVIKQAVKFGVIKLNVDTDLQWAYWDGIRKYEKKYHNYLQSQIGNPKGEDKPNKKYYDPRAIMRAGELSMIKRLKKSFEVLNCIDRN